LDDLMEAKLEDNEDEQLIVDIIIGIHTVEKGKHGGS